MPKLAPDGLEMGSKGGNVDEAINQVEQTSADRRCRWLASSPRAAQADYYVDFGAVFNGNRSRGQADGILLRPTPG